MSTIIKPKIKLNVTSHVQIVNNINDNNFENELKPYRYKVIEQLRKTQIETQFVEQLETLLKQQTVNEAEKLRCGRNFDLYKSLYLSICRHIISNLRINNYINNIQFIENINNGKITLEEAINMTP